MNPGLDCVERIRKYSGRNFSCHMKENVPTDWGFFGVGPRDGGKRVPWRETVDCLYAEPGFEWFVIECERRPDSFLPAKRNYEFLSALV